MFEVEIESFLGGALFGALVIGGIFILISMLVVA